VADLRQVAVGLGGLGLALLSGPASAQTAPSAVAGEAGPATTEGAAPGPSAKDSTEQRLAALEELVRAQQQELEQQRAADAAPSERERQLEEQVAALAAEMAEVREEHAAERERELDADLEPERLLRIYGFFDVTFAKAWPVPETNVLSFGLPTEASFVMGGVNVYLHSQMTRTLSAMVETRLTFLPNGYVEQRPATLELDGQSVVVEDDYQRVDTTVSGPLSLAEYRTGGILIERAHLDWTPKDWFNVRVGRFLTNYGIWNIDHGSPTLIGVLPPAMVSSQLVPSWQTGLELFGRYPLGRELALDAVATLSNGRGPIDEWRDLDDDMALSGRLRLSWDTPGTSLALGGFGYYGKSTDLIETTTLRTAADGTVDAADPESLVVEDVVVESYQESMLAADLRFAWEGLLVQSEGVERRVDYEVPTLLTQSQALVLGVPLGQAAYAPNNVGYAFYGLVGYTLPFTRQLGGVALTPYASVERSVPADEGSAFDQWQYRFGLNVRPSPYVTLKGEVNHVAPESGLLGEATTLYLQTAVSF
jgi:hypothetical protein